MGLACLASMLSHAHATERPIVAVFNDHKSTPYQQAQHAFEKRLRDTGRFDLVQGAVDLTSGSFTKRAPALLFAMGKGAIKTVHALDTDIPMLATMVLSVDALLGRSQSTAVLLKNSAKSQLEWHKRLLPRAQRVGVLYDPARSQAWIDEAQEAARAINLEIIAIAVRSPQELPGALKSLSRRADSLLGIPDRTVYSGSTAKAVLLFSFRNRIPFIGMSASWVKAGALYGMDWDYAAIGLQCADMAVAILNGAEVSEMTPQAPTVLHYQLNLKTAKHLKLDISDTLIAGASKVYK